MRKLLNKIGIGFASLGAFLMAKGSTALAQTDLGGTGTVNEIPIIGRDGDENALYDLVGTIINVVLIAVGVIAVMYLIYGGITYVTAGGDADKASQGRTTITNAIIGIIIIAASFAIYNYVVGALD